MDYKAIQELIKTMSDSKLTSLEVEADDIKIKLKKESQVDKLEKDKLNVKQEYINNLQVNELEVRKDGGLDEVSVESVLRNKEEVISKKDENLIAIKSPIVGTFYAAPSPEDPPFVSVGDKVKRGDVLCIIEAMKLMNEIEAEDDYEIVEILVENEEMVEYGETIFKVRKL
ncbi:MULTISPECIES: acetyl-CoA carboxylase biotin carboxyl carrier protein [Clostridium]|uniref:Biotin carboxyl carrier protein of acetyl-CoA carboxylase n=2 Tax=Clostridium TaxID=1485 RepID=A0A151AM60_9CLOT|nr:MULTISPECIES: acetyl-CoA carboxylase biotin carboxyl carrier protein [Clostridium]KYH28735.1 biotin carboxyl carrier protein of acetyl-CoA carboxylase [Clostridium colicanis DSM 13634]MBE6044937.1 acetyl-CoA carboxylase biotin carboxyl carrier protein [Clostridium thermopalmarium]PRR76968.1 Biotin carboxyl carrier protein of acetyl-CoA carboxylase [Clostridium thermopalmarium DSM 5974]PVZ21223.1 acetyl-CoA carboxylase biotin carboxyl carrier protein [Clostridium thermopalmarium DSM 5974]